MKLAIIKDNGEVVRNIQPVDIHDFVNAEESNPKIIDPVGFLQEVQEMIDDAAEFLWD